MDKALQQRAKHNAVSVFLQWRLGKVHRVKAGGGANWTRWQGSSWFLPGKDKEGIKGENMMYAQAH